MTTNPSKTEEDLESFWEDLLGNIRPPPNVAERYHPHPGEMIIATNQRMLVGIQPDGTLRFGEGYTPSEAAEIFWTSLALKRKDMEERLTHLGVMEQLMVRVGQADLRYEEASLRARLETAIEDDWFRSEMARRNLESLVHQMIEVCRGLALRDQQPQRPQAPEAPRPPQTDEALLPEEDPDV